MRLNKAVFILILILIINLSIIIKFFYLPDQNGNHIAIIEQNNREIKRINLSNVKEPYFIDIDSNYPSKILVEHDKISFYKSTCPDKICERYGKLINKGQIAVCLPSKIVIRIVGQNKNIDTITG